MDDTPAKPLTFAMQKAFAWAEGRWRNCPHGECKRRKRCTGGPRGTLRATGKPFCRDGTVAETIETRRARSEADRRFRGSAPPW